jgi:hypothetical protein
MVARWVVKLNACPEDCSMYDEKTGTEILFEQIDGKDYTVATIAGVLDLESADKIGSLVNDTISIEYDGNVVFDIRKADGRLRNEDAEEMARLVFRSRYFLRKPVAVLAPAESPGRSRQFSEYRGPRRYPRPGVHYHGSGDHLVGQFR